MTQQPTDGDRLVDFLRQHRPLPPPPDLDLEQQIMSAIAEKPRFEERRSRRLVLIAPAIAALVLIAWVGKSLLMPPTPTAAELASLEAFLENTWNDEPSDTSLDLVDPSDSTSN